jgi:hypothetical protein
MLLVGALEHDLFLCPFVTHFVGFCSLGSDLGSLSLFLLFFPLAGCFVHRSFARVSSCVLLNIR